MVTEIKKKTRLKVEILKLEMSMLKTRRDFHTRIDTLTGEYGELLDIPSTRLDLNKELRNAQNELKALLKIAIDERRKFIQDKHTQAMISNDSKEATKWKNQQKAEEIKAMYRKLRFISRDKTSQSGLTRIEVPFDSTEDPKKCTHWKTVDAPDEITKYLLERNQVHFGQAHGTPFTVSPLSTEIDFSASTETCEMILEGDYSNLDIDDLTCLLLKHLKQKAPLDILPVIIPEVDVAKKFSVWPEKTSTSPSGRHLGHYRALLPREIPKN